MAYEFATAANFADLVNRLVVFLTTDPSLTANGQAYTKLYDDTVPASGTTIASRRVAFRAPGLAGEEQIYLGLHSYGDSAKDWYNLRLFGGTGFSAELISDTNPDIVAAFAGASPTVQLLLWDQPMPYWFFANGRRFIVVAKVSTTVYESGYAGFVLPPCRPQQYPYPLAVAASYRGDKTVRWSIEDTLHRGITSPCSMSCFIREPGGRWPAFSSNDYSSDNGSGYLHRYLWPLGQIRYPSNNSNGGRTLSNLRDTLGSFPLLPVTFCTVGTEGRRQYGEMDGVYYVPALNSGAEDVVRFDGSDHIVFHTAWRSGNPWLFAVRAD